MNSTSPVSAPRHVGGGDACCGPARWCSSCHCRSARSAGTSSCGNCRRTSRSRATTPRISCTGRSPPRSRRGCRTGWWSSCRGSSASTLPGPGATPRWDCRKKKGATCRPALRGGSSASIGSVSTARSVIPRSIASPRTREPVIVAAGTSQTSDIQGLIEFFAKSAADPDFNADRILQEIDLVHQLSAADSIAVPLSAHSDVEEADARAGPGLRLGRRGGRAGDRAATRRST